MIYWMRTHKYLPFFKTSAASKSELALIVDEMLSSRPDDLTPPPLSLEKLCYTSVIVLKIDEDLCPFHEIIFGSDESWSWEEYRYQMLEKKDEAQVDRD